MSHPVAAERTHFLTCPLCEATCGLAVRVVGGEVTRIRGDRDDVFSKGFLCPKGSVLHHVHDDPDRLRQPMIRVGGELRPASWEEAWAVVTDRLPALRDAHGPSSTALYIGNPNAHGPCLLHIGALIGALASPNVFSASSVDQLPREVANGYLYGDPRAWPVPDVDRTDVLVILGANPVVSGGSLATAPDWPRRIEAIKQRGGRVVVIDPRRTETAERAGEWLGIRPGTDALLLAAITSALFADGLVDLGTVADLVDGVDEVEAAVRRFTPERVADTCAIPAVTIRQLAHDLASASSAAVYGRVGLHTQRFGTTASWLTDVVATCTGNLDRPGGTMFATPATTLPDPDVGRGFTTGRWRSRVSGHPECRGELPLAALPEEILTPGDGQIRTLLCLAGNPARSGPDSNRMEHALASLDLLVCVDLYLNETTRHADVILPPPSQLQRVQHDLFFYPMAVRNTVNHSLPVLPHDGPAEEDIIAGLAAITAGLGLDGTRTIHDLLLDGVTALAFPGIDPANVREAITGTTTWERALDVLLRAGPYGAGIDDRPGAGAHRPDGGLSLPVLLDHPHGIDLGPLVPSLPGRLRTPNQRIDLAPAPLVDDLDRLEDIIDRPMTTVLVGRRQLRSNNSWMHNIRVLAKGRLRCTLLVHPDHAAELGVDDGDTARVQSAAGAVDATVELSDSVLPGVVSLPHGWGHDATDARLSVAAQRPGVNANVLTNGADLDPLSGTCSISAIPVEVTPT